MRRTLCFLLGASIVPTVLAQYWVQHADFPYPVYATYGFSVGERYFSGGGVTDIVPLALVDSFYEYDANLDQWLARTPLPGLTRYGTPGFSIGQTNKGYVVCGWHNNIPQVQLNDLWEYDPLTDTWTQKADFPGPPRYSLISIGTSTKAYAGLGYNPWHNDWYEYDPVTDVWTQKTDFPGTARQAANAFVLNDQVYVGMGAATVGAGTAIFFNDLYRYDPATDSWTQMASLPALPRASSYRFSSCELAFIVGGIGFDSLGVQDVFTDMWRYDAVSDAWSQLPDFPGVSMNTGSSFNISSSGFVGFGGTGFQPASWIPDTLTGEFWEYKGCGFSTAVAAPEVPAPSVIVNGDGIVAFWDQPGRFDRFQLLDGAGRMIAERAIAGGRSIRLGSGAPANGIYFVRLTRGGTGPVVRVPVMR